MSAAGKHSPIGCELALGMDASLEATERELAEVRAILREAIEGLLLEFGSCAMQRGVVALQFQDLSDQLLANAGRRIGMVRAALGKHVAPPTAYTPPSAPLDAGSVELF